MDYAIFISVLALQTGIILFPERMNDVLFFRVPRAQRMDAARNVPVAAIALLLFMVLFFDAIYKNHPAVFPPTDGTAPIYTRYAAGVVFATLGLFLCIRPAGTLKRGVPRMRELPVSWIEENTGLVRFTQVVGVVLLVGGAYWLFRILE